MAGPARRLTAAHEFSPELTALLGRMFFNLRVALANITLYPAGSKQSVRGTGTVFGLISELLQSLPRLEIAEAEQQVLVNGGSPQLIPRDRNSARYFAGVMMRVELKSILLLRGLHLEELNEFLTFLIKPDLGSDETRAELLQEKKFPHIQFNRRQFVSITEKDLVISQGAEILERSQGGLDGIVQLIHQVMEMSMNLDDPAERDAARKQVAEVILERDPELLTKMLSGESGPVPPDVARALQDLTGGKKTEEEEKKDSPIGHVHLDPEVVRELLAKINHASRDIAATVPPGTPVARALETIRKTLTELLKMLGSEDVAFHLMSLFEGGEFEGADQGAGIAAYDEDAAAPTTAGEAAALLKRPQLELIGEEASRRLPELVRQLDRENRPELVRRLLESTAENIHANTAEIRLRAAHYFNEQLDQFEEISEKRALDALDHKFLAQQDREDNPAVYGELSKLLVRRADSLAKDGALDRVRAIVGSLRKHHETEGAFSERRELAMARLEELGHQDLMDILISEITAGQTGNYERCFPILVKLGNVALEKLIDALKSHKDLEVRHRLARVLKGIGRDAVAVLAERLEEEREVIAVHRLAEVLLHIGEDQLVYEGLRRLLDHADPSVRLEAVRLLKEKGGEPAGAIIFPHLDDGDPKVKLAAIGALGRLRYRPALKKFCELISPVSKLSREQDAKVQEEACAALGRIGRPEAVPALAEVLFPHGLIARPKPPAVQQAAAKALNRLGGREALARLAAGREHADADVRRLCVDLFLRQSAPDFIRLASAGDDIRLVTGEKEIDECEAGFASRLELVPAKRLFQKLSDKRRQGRCHLLLEGARGLIEVEGGQPRQVEFEALTGNEALRAMTGRAQGEFIFVARR